LLDAGVDVAIATDFNPGSAPSFHLPLALSIPGQCLLWSDQSRVLAKKPAWRSPIKVAVY